ncbi:hypothetical protein [Dyadobacter sp. 676]|uniref:Uncharacterized protein n=1 Tax=Dyadobacter sp. 676 TaxID=3088362 RepID=A0AAU8FIS4_9BACT
MKIKIVKKGDRNLLVCTRVDGSVEMADLGPQLPFHDIAHFLIERHLMLKHGFYGNIYHGYSVRELSSKEVIMTLNAESTIAEILTRALQAVGSGAGSADQFMAMVSDELSRYSIDYRPALDRTDVARLAVQYRELTENWKALQQSESIELDFPIENWT